MQASVKVNYFLAGNRPLYRILNSMQATVGIVVAMTAEANSLFGRKAWSNTNLHHIKNPSEDGHNYLVSCSGVGPKNAKTAAQEIVSNNVSALVSIGLAGGLAPDLKAGHIVIASDVLKAVDNKNDTPSWNSHTHTMHQACTDLKTKHLPVHCGSILTVEQALTNQTDKESLFARTGALAVDMESAAVAAVAHQTNLPFLGIRVVCDPSNMTVPTELLACLDQAGKIRLGTVVLCLMRRPSLLQEMIHMGRLFSRSRQILGQTWQILTETKAIHTLIS